MQKVLGLILAVARAEDMGVLTHYRPKSTLPFGGIYRFIDFAMSNLMHSDINRVGILFQYRSDSLIKHIAYGEAWDMIGGNREVTMLPPMRKPNISQWYRGNADAVYQNIEFIRDEDPDLVLIVSGDDIYHLDYQKIINFHVQNNADATLAFVDVPKNKASRFGQIEIDNCCGELGGRVIRYAEKPGNSILNSGSLTVYVFDAATLISTLDDFVEDRQAYDFSRDIFPYLIDRERVFAYKYRGYWGYANTIDEYWAANMELLQNSKRIDFEEWQIRTNLKNERISERPPSVFGPKATITNSLIYNGCEIKGHVERSIIFPGVQVGERSIVRNSILMFDTKIEQDVQLDKVILDVKVNIGQGTQIGIEGENIPNKRLPYSLRSGVTVIGRNTYIPKKMKINKNCIVYPNLDEGEFDTQIIESGNTVE